VWGMTTVEARTARRGDCDDRQRATCPPSAAVRQLSIADNTLSWPRLTWPALASRQAEPWPRKISATSKAGGHGSRASGRRLSLLELESDMLQRAHASRIVLVATRV
jgi:hypothetical protein